MLRTVCIAAERLARPQLKRRTAPKQGRALGSVFRRLTSRGQAPSAAGLLSVRTQGTVHTAILPLRISE